MIKLAKSATQVDEPLGAEVMTPLLSLQIELSRNARYQEDREAFFGCWSRVLDFCVLMLGTAIVASATKGNEWATVAVGAATTIAGAIQLVFQLSKNESTHRYLRERYQALAADLNATNIEEIRKQMLIIYGNEPPIYHAVNLLAYNAVMSYQRRPVRRKIPWHCRVFKHYSRFSNTEFARITLEHDGS